MDIPAQRQAQILKLLEQKGVLRIDELSQQFGVSVITIRRDLALLEERGLLERSHGGATIPQFHNYEPTYRDKGQKRINIKRQIAQKISSLVDEQETVFINSGSTAAMVMSYLCLKPKLTIFTNNVGALSTIDLHPESELILTGGSLRPGTSCLVGDDTISRLDLVLPTTTIIGIDGLSMRKGISSHNSHEAAVSRKMIKQTRGQVIVAADSSKIGSLSQHIISSLIDVDILVTDTLPDATMMKDFESLAIRVIALTEN